MGGQVYGRRFGRLFDTAPLPTSRAFPRFLFRGRLGLNALRTSQTSQKSLTTRNGDGSLEGEEGCGIRVRGAVRDAARPQPVLRGHMYEARGSGQLLALVVQAVNKHPGLREGRHGTPKNDSPAVAADLGRGLRPSYPRTIPGTSLPVLVLAAWIAVITYR